VEEFGIGYVMSAYGVIWLLFFGYALLLGRKLARLERDISRLSGDNEE